MRNNSIRIHFILDPSNRVGYVYVHDINVMHIRKLIQFSKSIKKCI